MKILNLIVFVASFFIIISFFLPWISIQSKGSGVLSSMFGKSDLGKVKTIKGYEIPRLANKKNSRVMIKVLEVFIGDFKDLDKKSIYIYIIPGITIIMILGSSFNKNYRLIALIFFILGCGIYFISLYKIYTTNLDFKMLKISIEEGIKYTQYSYLTIGIVGLIRLIFLS